MAEGLPVQARPKRKPGRATKESLHRDVRGVDGRPRGVRGGQGVDSPHSDAEQVLHGDGAAAGEDGGTVRGESGADHEPQRELEPGGEHPEGEAADRPASEEDLAFEILQYQHDPLGFVTFAYPWGEGDLANSSGPRTWQAEVLDYIGQWLRNPLTRHQPCRVAICSGHGIGKSACIAMLNDWALSTLVQTKVTITANTFDQLNTKTAVEAAKWFRQSVNAHWWNIAATSIKFNDEVQQQLWRCDFLPWSSARPQAFGGLHNKDKRILLVFDEASEIEDIIWETASGALSDKNTEIIWIVCGNPTQPQGRFYDCFHKEAAIWKTFRIDARTVDGTNTEEIQRQIDLWGEDSDFVRVRWRGEFPRSGSNQLIPHDAVALCRKYKAEGYDKLPKIMACDVARFGADQTVIGIRQGRKFSILGKHRGLSSVQVAERMIALMAEHKPHAVVVDGDGGYGAGVIDQLDYRGFNRNIFSFHGAVPAHEADKYYNRRAEVWGMMGQQIISGMEIPDDPELAEDLTTPVYMYSTKGSIQLESKEDMKKRGKSSPDCGDCLAYTFAVTVAPPPPEPEPQTWNYETQDLTWMA